MTSFRDVCVEPCTKLQDVLRIIDNSSKQIALVVGDTGKLLGTITDGDIRRGLLAGVSLADDIENIYFKMPTVCHVSDPKEKIYEIALSKSLKQIPIVDDNGVLVGLELFDDLLKNSKKANKVVLMVGGLGSRLGDITKSIPKPMLSVGGRPILEIIISNFAKHGFTDIVLSVNHLSHVIEDYFGNGENFGVSIKYVHEKERMGTAGALDLMRSLLSEPFFVMNGDILTNVNFENLLDYHISNDAVGTMCVREYDLQVPYGVVNIEDGRINSIDEKPVHKFFVSAGIYMFSPDVLSFIPQNSFYDMPTLFDAMIKAKKNILSFPIREYWLDIGRIADFERANMDYKEIFDA